MARPKYEEPGDKDGPELKRVPVKLDESAQDMLREMAVVWFRKPIERLAGDWLRERILAEYKKGKPKPAKKE